MLYGCLYLSPPERRGGGWSTPPPPGTGRIWWRRARIWRRGWACTRKTCRSQICWLNSPFVCRCVHNFYLKFLLNKNITFWKVDYYKYRISITFSIIFNFWRKIHVSSSKELFLQEALKILFTKWGRSKKCILTYLS